MKQPKIGTAVVDAGYDSVFRDVAGIVTAARQAAARSVNAVMTAAYWMIGRHIVEFEQSGEERAAYGTALIERLALDLKRRFGRGFSRQNPQQMRVFYLTYPPGLICQTLSGKSSDSSEQTMCQTPSGHCPPGRRSTRGDSGGAAGRNIVGAPQSESFVSRICCGHIGRDLLRA